MGNQQMLLLGAVAVGGFFLWQRSRNRSGGGSRPAAMASRLREAKPGERAIGPKPMPDRGGGWRTLEYRPSDGPPVIRDALGRSTDPPPVIMPMRRMG